MSFETWAKKYYPIPANKCKKADAVDHSLQKWIGLRSKNLKAHGLFSDGFGLCEYTNCDAPCVLDIDSDTCALCQHHVGRVGNCQGCPLFVALGGSRCDRDPDSPYWLWTDDENPEPMIRALRKAKKLVDAKKEARKAAAAKRKAQKEAK